jgi:hypothetical protein
MVQGDYSQQQMRHRNPPTLVLSSHTIHLSLPSKEVHGSTSVTVLTQKTQKSGEEWNGHYLYLKHTHTKENINIYIYKLYNQ